MAIPDTSDGLKAAGYEYSDDGTCRGCGTQIEFWITPRGKKMPFNTKIVGTLAEGNRREVLECHFVSCPEADRFRK
jgi:hypothetical protein